MKTEQLIDDGAKALDSLKYEIIDAALATLDHLKDNDEQNDSFDIGFNVGILNGLDTLMQKLGFTAEWNDAREKATTVT
jgi:hypothetical protein